MGSRRSRRDPALLDKDNVRKCVRRIGMLAVDLMLLLESYDIEHDPVVDDIMSLKGYVARLCKMLHQKNRLIALRKLAEEQKAQQ